MKHVALAIRGNKRVIMHRVDRLSRSNAEEMG